METQLFLWTGKIIWWVICCSAVACVVGGGILAPIMVRRKIYHALWLWILSAELSKYGLSVDDMSFIVSIPGQKPEEYENFRRTCQRLHERREALEKQKAR